MHTLDRYQELVFRLTRAASQGLDFPPAVYGILGWCLWGRQNGMPHTEEILSILWSLWESLPGEIRDPILKLPLDDLPDGCTLPRPQVPDGVPGGPATRKAEEAIAAYQWLLKTLARYQGHIEAGQSLEALPEAQRGLAMMLEGVRLLAEDQVWGLDLLGTVRETWESLPVETREALVPSTGEG